MEVVPHLLAGENHQVLWLCLSRCWASLLAHRAGVKTPLLAYHPSSEEYHTHSFIYTFPSLAALCAFTTSAKVSILVLISSGG